MAFNYSVMLDICNKRTLVVGGGKVAIRKIKTLLASNAQVTVVAPEVLDEIENLAEKGVIELSLKKFATNDIEISKPFIVFAATDNIELNKSIALYCQERNLLVNTITEPALGNMAVQAKIVKPDYAISMSTFGKSPGFAKAMREYLEAELDEYFDISLNIYLDIRKEILDSSLEAKRRTEILQQLDLKIIRALIVENDNMAYNDLLKKVKEWLFCS